MSAAATEPVIDEWRTTPLKAEVTLKNGKAYNAADWKKDGYPIIRIQNLKNPLAKFNYFQGDPEAEVPIRSGDLVFSWSGSKGTSFGPYIWRGELGVLNQHIFKVVMNSNSQLRQDFLYFALKFLTATIEDKAYGLAALVHVRKGDLESTPIPLPPLPEQKKIAHILSSVQRAIEAQERIIQSTTELKRVLMHKLFTEGLRHESQQQTEIGPVPKSWEVVKLETVCELVVDCPHTTPKFLPCGERVARNFNIRDGKFVREPAFFTSEEQYLERVRRAVPEPGDVLFSREAPVGEACVIPEGTWLSLGQRTMLIRADRKRLIPEFLVYTFYSPVVSAHIKSTASGLTVAHLNVADVRRMPLPLPSPSVQSEIAAALLAIDNKIEQHRAKRERLQDLFRTLLQELMTAKTRAHGLDLTT
jgi:type I restriction enzyme S subunit